MNKRPYYHCLTNGDKRFDEREALILYNGYTQSIGEIIQRAFNFNLSDTLVENLILYDRTTFTIGRVTLPIHFLADYYTALWLKYLIANPDLFAYAETFQTIGDPTTKNVANNPCSAIARICYDGLERTRQKCQPLLDEYRRRLTQS